MMTMWILKTKMKKEYISKDISFLQAVLQYVRNEFGDDGFIYKEVK